MQGGSGCRGACCCLTRHHWALIGRDWGGPEGGPDGGAGVGGMATQSLQGERGLAGSDRGDRPAGHYALAQQGLAQQGGGRKARLSWIQRVGCVVRHCLARLSTGFQRGLG